MAPRKRQQLLADGAVDGVLRLLREVLHEHVLRRQADAPVAPADRRADAAGVLEDRRRLRAREHLDQWTHWPRAADFFVDSGWNLIVIDCSGTKSAARSFDADV